MCEGYNTGVNDYSGLEDELLCEYVDGTMDPLIREVFEEYLGLNPDLREHVECLQNTRKLLCRYGCRCHAPRDLHERLRREISCELMRARVPFHLVLSDHLRSFATVTSAMALLLLVGMMAGVTVFEADPTTGPVARQADVFGIVHSSRAQSHSSRAQGHSSRAQSDRPAVPLKSKSNYSRLSAFTTPSAFRSLVSSDFHARWVRTDSSFATLRTSRSAP